MIHKFEAAGIIGFCETVSICESVECDKRGGERGKGGGGGTDERRCHRYARG